MTFKKLNILITGAGAPGIKGTIYSLKNNFDGREIKIYGTDIDQNAVGKYVCDVFFKISPANQKENYLSDLMEICLSNNIQVIIPQNTMELTILNENRFEFYKHNIKIVLASEKMIDVANNKYELMLECESLGIPVGKFFLVNDSVNLLNSAKNLGWPEKKVVVKPPVSNGMRGVRIISEQLNRKKMFFENKPNSLIITMDDLLSILGEKFPELIVTEFLPGPEYSVDVLRTSQKTLVIPRIRHKIRSGITFFGEVINHGEIIEYSKKISSKLKMFNCFGFQFKLDENDVPKILESNPRVQGSMVMSTFAGANIIYSAVKNILDEEVPDFKVEWGTKFNRYWGGVGTNNSIFYL